MHDEVKVGTLAGILRQADISPDQFIAAFSMRRAAREVGEADVSPSPA
jgi:hypothetical protein